MIAIQVLFIIFITHAWIFILQKWPDWSYAITDLAKLMRSSHLHSWMSAAQISFLFIVLKGGIHFY